MHKQQKEYPIPDEGIYNAAAIDCVDLGKIKTPWGPKEKISIMFELDGEDENDNRFILGKRYTKSLNEKSNLRQDLERWQSRKFKP